MPTDVVMPALGMAQETGRLVRWLKREGDNVSKGEPLMEVETDKATVEVESPATGRLSSIAAAEGEDIAVGRSIAVILGAGESAADIRRMAEPSAAEEAPRRDAAPPPHSAVNVAGPRAVASPKARRLAEERGIDLGRVRGTGAGGAVLEEDVLQAGSAASTDSRLWRAMAENVSRSWRDAPHFYLVREIDAVNLQAEREQQAEGVTYTDLIVGAVAAALKRHQRMNGGHHEVNIGLAVATPEGLIVPVIHGADRMSIAQLAEQRRALLERVRSGRARSGDLSGGTFSVSNLGMYGIDLFTAIVTEGQAGILAVGRIADRVVARGGSAEVRPTMLMSVSCDHRQVDGARAAEFVATLASLLEGTGGTKLSSKSVH